MRALFIHFVSAKIFIPELGKYVICPRLTFNPADSAPMAPYGYILNLGVKYLGDHPKNPSPKIIPQKLIRIIQLSTLLSTITAVQPYSNFEVQFQSKKPLSIFLQDIALFDSIYGIESAMPADAVETTGRLFAWLDNGKMAALFGFTLQEFLQTSSAIISIAGNTLGPVPVYLSALKKKLPLLPEPVIQKILFAMSQESAEVNKDYRYPQNYDKCDIGFKPLIKFSATKFCMPDQYWAAPAFYETLAAIARVVEPQQDVADSSVGTAMENMIKGKLAEKKISFASGYYFIGKERNECDLVIETEKVIIIIEIKKKTLRRISRTGRDAYLLVDLASSLLNAQIQAGKMELLLRKQGYVDIDDGTGKKRVEFRDKTIERIALTLNDFGRFQDRVVINDLLTILAGSKINLLANNDPKLAADFQKMQKKLDVWAKQAVELKSIDPGFDDAPFFDCWFLSYNQLLALLKYAGDNEEFYTALRSTKHITMGSSNFYFEFYHCFIVPYWKNKAGVSL